MIDTMLIDFQEVPAGRDDNAAGHFAFFASIHYRHSCSRAHFLLT